MSAFTQDGQMQSEWHIRVGSTFKKDYLWEAGTPPAPVDLSLWTGKAQIYDNDKAVTPILTLTTENGGIVLGADGSIHFEIDYDEQGTMLLLGKKKAVFDFELTSPDGSFRRNLIGGPVIVYGERTKV